MCASEANKMRALIANSEGIEQQKKYFSAKFKGAKQPQMRVNSTKRKGVKQPECKRKA